MKCFRGYKKGEKTKRKGGPSLVGQPKAVETHFNYEMLCLGELLQLLKTTVSSDETKTPCRHRPHLGL